MSGPGVGFEYRPQEVSWRKRDVLLFANSIGATADELHLLYVWAGSLARVDEGCQGMKESKAGERKMKWKKKHSMG